MICRNVKFLQVNRISGVCFFVAYVIIVLIWKDSSLNLKVQGTNSNAYPRQLKLKISHR